MMKRNVFSKSEGISISFVIFLEDINDTAHHTFKN